MSQDQIMGLLRQILPIIGGIATALGWISPEKVASLTATILSIAGPVIALAGIVWALVANSKSSIAASIGAMAETRVTPTAGGTATVVITDPALAKAAVAANNAAT